MPRRCLSVLIAVAFLLSACGGGSDDTAASPSPDPSEPSTTTPAAPTPAETPLPTVTAEAAKMAVAELGSSVADTAEEKAVVEAWMTYWKAVVKTYDDLVPAAGLASARGGPRDDVLSYLSTLKDEGRRSVGWTRENVLSVEVDGNSASLTDCAENFSFEVDAEGRPTEEVTPFYLETGQLTKDGDRWVVTGRTAKPMDRDCRE
jgi:hypothetical protein